MTLISERPGSPAPRPWSFPGFSRSDRLVTCDLRGRPLAVASLVVDAGAATEPQGKEGVSLLLARALTQGTLHKDAFDFAVACERLGASVEVDVEWDSMRCVVEAPIDTLLPAVQLMAEALHTPALEASTLQRLRDERVDELALESSQPAARAAKEFARQIFMPSSRYGRPEAGDPATVAAISDEDIRRFYAERLRPELSTLVVVGDLAAEVPAQLHSVLFDGWTSGSGRPVPVDVTTNTAGRRIVIVDRPGSVQSMLQVGHAAPGRAIDDYVATTTMAMVLGGMFNSRLNMKLREEKGYTYGAFGGFELRRHAGTFSARAAVETDVTVPALEDMIDEIAKVAADGITETERDDTVAYRSGVFPVGFAGVESVAHALGNLVVHGWGDDYFDRLRDEVMAVTTAELTDAAARRLHPDELVIIVVGDAAAVGPKLRAAGLGPVETVSDAS